jgi:hypothetical protein
MKLKKEMSFKSRRDSMNCWEILGINATVDVKIIKKAYAEKLKTCHPEDNPEAFIHLRRAYEEALRQTKVLMISEDNEMMQSKISPLFLRKKVFLNFNLIFQE